MVRSKLTMEEQVQNLNLRATEALQKARRTSIVAAMRSRPHLVIDPLWEKLQSLGLTSEGSDGDGPARTQSLQAQAAAMRKKAKTEVEEVHQKQVGMAVESELGVAQPTEPIAAKTTRLDMLGVNVLRDRLLPAVEETILSPANLRAIKDKDHTSKIGLLRYLDFTCGLSADFELRGIYRCMLRLCELCRQRAVARGRRALTITLPANWPTDGIYEKVGDEVTEKGSVMVKQRFTGEVVEVSSAVLPPFECFDDLTVAYNWSESRACLVSSQNPTHDKAVVLGRYFCCHTVSGGGADSNSASKSICVTPTAEMRNGSSSGSSAKRHRSSPASPERIRAWGTGSSSETLCGDGEADGTSTPTGSAKNPVRPMQHVSISHGDGLTQPESEEADSDNGLLADMARGDLAGDEAVASPVAVAGHQEVVDESLAVPPLA